MRGLPQNCTNCIRYVTCRQLSGIPAEAQITWQGLAEGSMVWWVPEPRAPKATIRASAEKNVSMS